MKITNNNAAINEPHIGITEKIPKKITTVTATVKVKLGMFNSTAGNSVSSIGSFGKNLVTKKIAMKVTIVIGVDMIKNCLIPKLKCVNRNKLCVLPNGVKILPRFAAIAIMMTGKIGFTFMCLDS